MEALEYSVEEGIARVMLNNPQRKNALSPTMKRELEEAIGAIRRDLSVKAVVIGGAGGAFCAGGDVGAMQAAAMGPEQRRNAMAELHGWLQQLLELDRPVIAAVDGVAYGAGFSLALAADMVIATPRARFCMVFLRIGLVPDLGAFYTLPRVVGLQRAKELVFSAREVDVEEAQRLGIVLEVQPVERLLPRALELARSFTQASATALSLAKRGLNASLGSDLTTVLELEASAQAVASATDYHKEAVRRFMAKEEPLFRWPAEGA